ncbi:MAG: tetratricopeptide repeat protein [Myxococcaceae bacterium]|nr:tetratricopeptide repeat protein [Myxococcaceae bacterium]
MRFRLTVTLLLVSARAFADASVQDLAVKVEAVKDQVKNSRDNIEIVEKQYSAREEPSEEAAREARFSDGEIKYLLGDYENAAVLFYDLVANKDFQQSKRYPDALFYLADSLYQQKNYLGAKLYLKLLLGLRAGHYREALARYLEIAGRLNEFNGIDEHINQARGLSGGELPPELNYVYAKWLFRREDIEATDRTTRAINIFQGIASVPNGALYLQAAYFVGVGQVKLKKYDEAIATFKKVATATPRDERERSVKELAILSLGRVMFETGKYDEAIEQYQEIPRESDSFPDSLYEMAWSFIRKQDYQRAKNATDILLLVAENSVLAPEAQILQGTLLLKLKKYDDATEQFNNVINTYAPVRDEIDALLTVNKDPAKYFDDLIARNERTLDISQLLPPAALKWATTQREVSDAVAIINALEAGKSGVLESQQIAARILKGLDERGLEVFPVIQEGYMRADAVDTALTRAEEQLTAIESELLGKYLAPDQHANVEQLKKEALELQQRIQTLPTTEAEVQQRKDRIRAKIDEVDRKAYQTQLEIQSQYAQLAAIQKYVDDTRRQRKNTPEEEKEFLEKVNFERKALEGVEADLAKVRADLQDEKNNADAAIGGEETLRREYEASLGKQRDILLKARGLIPNDATQVLLRSEVVRADAASLRDRVAAAKATLRDRVTRKAAKLREMVQHEQELLSGYGNEVAMTSSQAKGLVGRIAFDSFRRVRASFYDLVLKADVGVVDVAFTRKQDKTIEIQKLATQKDRELKQLDEEFKEVLKDVD